LSAWERSKTLILLDTLEPNDRRRFGRLVPIQIA
jgi:hypothetical protein